LIKFAAFGIASTTTGFHAMQNTVIIIFIAPIVWRVFEITSAGDLADILARE
jgi:hypothetical protein